MNLGNAHRRPGVGPGRARCSTAINSEEPGGPRAVPRGGHVPAHGPRTGSATWAPRSARSGRPNWRSGWPRSTPPRPTVYKLAAPHAAQVRGDPGEVAPREGRGLNPRLARPEETDPARSRLTPAGPGGQFPRPISVRQDVSMNVALPKFAEPGPIHDVKWVPLKFFHDSRGLAGRVVPQRPDRPAVSPGDGLRVDDKARGRPRAARARRPGRLLLLHRPVHVPRLPVGRPARIRRRSGRRRCGTSARTRPTR